MNARHALWASVALLAAGCAADVEDADVLEDVDGVDGKADGTGWSRKVVSSSAALWNGGIPEWGAGTSIGVRADGSPVIAFYTAEHICRNGGFGLASSDALMISRMVNGAWTRTTEACGPTSGYWPRLSVDASDRTHVVFGSGWSSGQQRATYLRKNAAWVREEWNPWLHSSSMSTGPLALTLDDTGAPTLFVDGQLITIGTSGSKTPIFERHASRAFFEQDSAGTFHFLGSTFIPDSPTSATSRMRYASRAGSTVTVEIVRTELRAQPLGLVIDTDDQPHILSMNPGATPGNSELWHSTRTASGWVDTLIANDAFSSSSAAMTITADDELLVVTGGKLYRRAAGATTWTASAATVLGGAKHLSAIVGFDDTLHVSFQMVGATRNNRSAPAPVYHASLKL
jgi:hypothetical protein